MRTRQGYLFKRGKVYYVGWRVNGKLFMRSTGETSKRKAEAKRAEIMAPFVAGDDVTVLQNIAARIEGREAELARLEDEQNPPLTFDKAWSAYLQSPNRPDSGERTLGDYAGYLAAFITWMKEHHADRPALRDVTPTIAAEYAVALGKRLSPNSFNKHIRFLELIYRATRDRARWDRNPWEDIKRKRQITSSRRELTVDELRKVCSAADGEMRLLLALGIYTGLRLGDCVTLRWGEVDTTRNLIRRVPNKTARRNPKPVLVPLHPTLKAMLEEIPTADRLDYVLPGFAALYLKSTSEMSKRVHQHFEDCGVRTHKPGTGYVIKKDAKGKEKRVPTGKRAVVEVGFHSLRHTFVSLCREANAPLAVVEAIVGHANPAMTRHYTHIGEAAAGAAVAALPDVTGDASPTLASATTITVPADRLRSLVEELTPDSALRIKSDLLELIAQQNASIES